MHPFAVFDIDGVLADVRHRLAFVQSVPKSWGDFFGRAHLDAVLEPGRQLVHATIAARHPVVYSTGRPEHCREDTVEWLAAHGLPDAPLYMRSDADRRPGRVTKLELARRLRAQSGVAFLVDDDPVVVEALRDDGFAVLHATWMGMIDDPAAHEAEARDLLFSLQEEGEL